MISGDELVKRVRRLVNEAEDDASVSLMAVDRCSFDTNVRELMPQAVAFVQRNKGLPGMRVNVKSAHGLVAEASGAGARVELPRDYVSLVQVRLEGWRRPCRAALVAGSPMAALQENGYASAGCCRPVCVEGCGDGVLYLYPLPYGADTVTEFLYEAQYDEAEGLGTCDACMADAVAYECAALLYTVFERYDAANMFHSLALASCNGKVNEKK